MIVRDIEGRGKDSALPGPPWRLPCVALEVLIWLSLPLLLPTDFIVTAFAISAVAAAASAISAVPTGAPGSLSSWSSAQRGVGDA